MDKLREFVGNYFTIISAIFTGLILTIVTTCLFVFNTWVGALYVFFLVTEMVYINIKLMNN